MSFDLERGDHAPHGASALAPASLVVRDGAFYWLAERYRRVGRADRAEELLSGGLESRPQHLGARVARARLLLARGERTGARADVEAVLRDEPNHWSALLLLARLMAAEGWIHAERAVVRRLQHLDPGHPKLLQWVQRLDHLAARMPTAPAFALPARGPDGVVATERPVAWPQRGADVATVVVDAESVSALDAAAADAAQHTGDDPKMEVGRVGGGADEAGLETSRSAVDEEVGDGGGPARTPPSAFRAVTNPGARPPADLARHFLLVRRGTTQPAAAVPSGTTRADVVPADGPAGIEAAVARGELAEAREIMLRMLRDDPSRDSLRRRFLECGGREDELPALPSSAAASVLAEPDAIESLLVALRASDGPEGERAMPASQSPGADPGSQP